jgi:hypothetical protein
MPSSSSCIGSVNRSGLIVYTPHVDGGTGYREGVESCRHTVPSCILIMRMVCLPKLDSVIAFGVDEARRNLRPIQPRLSGICR